MTESVPTLEAGSVGTVETRYLDLPEPVRLDCGRQLHPVRVAYETYGVLSRRATTSSWSATRSVAMRTPLGSPRSRPRRAPATASPPRSAMAQLPRAWAGGTG